MKIGYLMQAGVPDVRRRPLSGPAHHVMHVFNALRKLGHHLSLLAVLDGRIWKSDDLECYEPVSVRWLDKGPFRVLESATRRFQYEFRLPYANLFESLRFALACRQAMSDCNLFYERMGWVGYGGGLAARWLGIPLILEVNGDHLTEMEMLGVAPRGAQRWLSVALMKQAVGVAAHAVATGQAWRKRHIDRWGISPEKINVIENGSELVNLLVRDQLRSFHPCSDLNGLITIVYSGGFEPWQGVPVLIRTVARVIATGISIRLLLIGSGSGVSMAERLVCELQLGKYVTFTGQLAPQQYAERLSEADFGISPYCGRSEYSGLKLIDYKAAGLAIVASGEDGQPAIIDDGRTGRIVAPCDENALFAAIVQLSSNMEFSKRMGRQARIEAEQLHGWDKTAERLNDLFNRVVTDGRGNTTNRAS